MENVTKSMILFLVGAIALVVLGAVGITTDIAAIEYVLYGVAAIEVVLFIKMFLRP